MRIKRALLVILCGFVAIGLVDNITRDYETERQRFWIVEQASKYAAFALCVILVYLVNKIRIKL